MKRILWPGVILLLVAGMIGIVGCDSFSPEPRITSGAVSGQNTGIWVTGEGKVYVVPDVAILNVGVEAQADTVGEAIEKASTGMANVGSALTDHGVESKDIQTNYFSIQQRTRWDNVTDEEVVTGYSVTNKMTVKIRVLPVESVTIDYKASNIIDTVIKAGGDLIRIDSFSFTVDDPVLYQKEAREKALDDAKAKARQIADKAGLKLGNPTYINETSSSYPYPVSMAYEAAVPVISGGTSISPGETTITVYVQVAYGIK
jgi:uncharacterized protein YggE